MTLEELLGALGGAICTDGEHRWLESQVGGLRACITTHTVWQTNDVVVELAVVAPNSLRSAHDPVFDDMPVATWSNVQPRLTHGFIFVGQARDDVLFARSIEAPSLEGVVAALWMLAQWARNPPPASTAFVDSLQENDRQRRKRRFRWLVFLVVAVWIFVSWLRPRLDVLLHPRIG